MKRQAFVRTLLALLVSTPGALGTLGCSDDDNPGLNQNGNGADAGVDASNPTPDAAVVDDPLCPLGQECTEVRTEHVGCLFEGQVPPGGIYGCAETDGPECPGNMRCLYLDDAESNSACVDYCGECPEAQSCGDITGGGDFACTLGGRVPAGVTTGCYQTGGCPPNTSCFFYSDTDPIESFCLERCSPCREGSCPEGEVCDLEAGVCEPAPCTEGSCEEGEMCFQGRCIPDIGDGPGAGPGPTCASLPLFQCEGTADYCGELVQFLPDNNPVGGTYDAALGYVEWPENGETWENQYRSFLRRDLMMAIQYAAALTACKADTWTFGNGGDLGTIDMSEADGSIPGTSVGSPGHPEGTHTNGFDIDMAYYQVNTSNNRARPVCDHYEGGTEAYHCTAPPHLLDPWRTALFIGTLITHPATRVIGVDGQVGPLVEDCMDVLCQQGWLSGAPCATNRPLAYEVTNQNYGWYYFHHHHFHVSFEQLSYKSGGENRCLVPGCDRTALEVFLGAQGVALAPRLLLPVNQSLLLE